MTNLNNALHEIRKALEYSEMYLVPAVSVMPPRRAIELIDAIIKQIPEGLDDDIDVLENTLDGQAKLRQAAKLLQEIGGDE